MLNDKIPALLAENCLSYIKAIVLLLLSKHVTYVIV